MSKDISRNLKPVYEFGPFKADVTNQVLLRDGHRVSLPSKAFDVLAVLLERNGVTIEKSELIRKVWPDSFVEEINLLVQVSTLRKALGDTALNPMYIATVSKHGYKFISDVKVTYLPEDGEGRQDITGETDRAARAVEVAPGEDVITRDSAPSPAAKNNNSSARAVLVSLLVISLLCALIYAVQRGRNQNREGQEPPKYAAKSLVILPFKVMGPDKASNLGAEIASKLKSLLSKTGPITSWPPDSIKLSEGSPVDPLKAGRDLGASLVLNGVVRRVGDSVQVTAQLMGADDGSPLWVDEFSYRSEDLFAAQEVISKRLIDGLAPVLTGEQRAATPEERSKDLKAYELFLRGHFAQQKRTREGLKESARFFEEATRIDPGYAQAYGELAYCYFVLRLSRCLSTEEAIPRVIAAAVKALELDDKLGWVHALLGFSRALFEWEWEKAGDSFARAVNSGPDLFTHIWYSQYLTLINRPAESRAEVDQALRDTPDSLDAHVALANHFYWLGQYDEAIHHLTKMLVKFPYSYSLHQALGAAYREKGRYEEAITMAERAAAIAQERMLVLWEDPSRELAYAYAVAGKRAEALKVLAGIKNKEGASPYGLAEVFAALGEYDKSIEWLWVAFDKRDPELPWLKFDPAFKNMRSDDRLAMLLRLMRL
jgi:DNA-binding winged helix-turn-helix (wHTH) protein/TolB-like protein